VLPEHEISEILGSIQSLTGLGLCLYDLNDYFEYNATGFRRTTGHYCAFCNAAKELSGGRDACNHSDRTEAISFARNYRNIFLHQCRMGLYEMVIPIMNRDTLLGIFFLGQCRIRERHDETLIRERASAAGGDSEYFLTLSRELPEVSEAILTAWSRILFYSFRGLAERKQDGPAPLSMLLSNQNQQTAERIAAYIDENFAQPLTLSSIAQKLYLTPSYVSHTFREKRQMTVTDYIMQVRIRRARELLRTTNLPISNIAINTGFLDSNYFTRVFRRLVGSSPSEYRKRQQTIL